MPWIEPWVCLASPPPQEDGSLDVWDLRESPVHGLLGAEVGWAGHLPCYSTARVLAEEGHRAAVVCITVVGLPSGREEGR